MDVYKISGGEFSSISAGIYYKKSSSESNEFHVGTKTFKPTAIGQWQTIQQTFTITTEFVEGSLNIYGHNALGELLVDNVHLVDITEHTVTSKTVTYNTAYGKLPVAFKTGNIFLGWFTKLTGGTQVTSDTIMTSTADHTIYAIYQPIQYKLSLEFYVDGVKKTAEEISSVGIDGTIKITSPLGVEKNYNLPLILKVLYCLNVARITYNSYRNSIFFFK